MNINEIRAVLPGFEPEPPIDRIPAELVGSGTRNRFGKFNANSGEYGSGAFRWCACQVFEIYLNPSHLEEESRFRKPYSSDEPVIPDVTFMLNPRCQHVTRSMFAKNHQHAILNRLAESEAAGLMCCLTWDRTPRRPFEVGRLFGITINPKAQTYARNTKGFWDRRLDSGHNPFASLAEKSARTRALEELRNII